MFLEDVCLCQVQLDTWSQLALRSPLEAGDSRVIDLRWGARGRWVTAILSDSWVPWQAAPLSGPWVSHLQAGNAKPAIGLAVSTERENSLGE